MNQHHGQIVERIIRRNGYSISELARLTKVNRRSVYNWFNQKHLKAEIIYRIGHVLNYDFSGEFPELFNKEKQTNISSSIENSGKSENTSSINQNTCMWKDKYIDLLERYNKLLLNCIESSSQSTTPRPSADESNSNTNT